MTPMQTVRSALFLLVLFAQGASAQTRELPDFTALMKKQGPAVVNVTAKRARDSPPASSSARTATSSPTRTWSTASTT
jgi:hypothetical protein